MKIVKTKTLDNLIFESVVSHPSGDCPYYLVSVLDVRVETQDLQSDVVEDTAEFFSGYDLSEGEEEMPD